MLLRLEVLLRKFAARLDQWQKIRLHRALAASHLLFKLDALFFLHLLNTFEEKVLDVRSLVKHHLADSSQIFELLVFEPCRLDQVPQLGFLIPNNLFVLELEQFTFLFEIADDLCERFLKQLNFGFQKFDLLLFLKLPLAVIIHCEALLVQFVVELVVLASHDVMPRAQVVKFVFLQLGFVLEALVLSLDIALDLRNVFLGLLLGILLRLLIELG